MIEAFGSTTVIGISHAAKLAPLLKAPFTRKQMEEAAVVVAAEQALRRSSDRVPLAASQVMTRLVAKPLAPTETVRHAVVTDEQNRTLVSGERAASGMVTIKMTPLAQRQTKGGLDAVRQLLDQLC